MSIIKAQLSLTAIISKLALFMPGKKPREKRKNSKKQGRGSSYLRKRVPF
jgi:hypothetical protein